jgi:hypothetical protein
VVTKPDFQLVDQVQVGFEGPAHGRVVSLAFTVIFAPSNVNSQGSQESRDAVTSVKVEPEVTDLKGEEFGDSEAADGRKGNHEPIPVVPDGETPKAKHGSYKEAVHREKEGGGAADQARQTAGPCGELPEAVDWGCEARDPVSVLYSRPDGGDDGAWGAQAKELPGQAFKGVGGHGEDQVDSAPSDSPGDHHGPVVPVLGPGGGLRARGPEVSVKGLGELLDAAGRTRVQSCGDGSPVALRGLQRGGRRSVE